MTKLKQLTRELNPIYFNYFDCECYEALEIHTPNERLSIDYFGYGILTRVRFSGEVERMRRTINSLRIPTSWPSNLGEKVFHRFRQSLEELDEGEVTIEQYVKPGKEHQFISVLKRLVEHYRNQRAENSISFG